MPSFNAIGMDAVASYGTASQVVTPPADTTSPTLNGPVVITSVTTTGAHAAWPAGSDNVGIAAYEVSCDTGAPSWVDVGTALARDFSALTPNTAYTVRVRARDPSNNYSAPITQGFTTSQVYVPPTPATNVSIQLVGPNNAVRANLSGLQWAFFDQALPGSLGAPVAKGTSGSTNASGVMSINISGTVLLPGAIGWLVVSDSNGSPTQSPASRSFSGPVEVS